MKNLIPKVVLLLLCSAFTLSSCSNDDSAEKKTVTVKYRILVNADTDYRTGLNGGGIQKLYLYIQNEMDAVSKTYNKEAWTITETAETEEAAIAACDKKAIAEFDEKLSAINAATELVKEQFEAKKAELLPEIKLDSKDAHVIYNGYGGFLFKGDPHPNVVVKESSLVILQAIGGE